MNRQRLRILLVEDNATFLSGYLEQIVGPLLGKSIPFEIVAIAIPGSHPEPLAGTIELLTTERWAYDWAILDLRLDPGGLTESTDRDNFMMALFDTLQAKPVTLQILNQQKFTSISSRVSSLASVLSAHNIPTDGLCDYEARLSGLFLLRLLAARWRSCEFIIVSAFGDDEVKKWQKGAALVGRQIRIVARQNAKAGISKIIDAWDPGTGGVEALWSPMFARWFESDRADCSIPHNLRYDDLARQRVVSAVRTALNNALGELPSSWFEHDTFWWMYPHLKTLFGACALAARGHMGGRCPSIGAMMLAACSGLTRGGVGKDLTGLLKEWDWRRCPCDTLEVEPADPPTAQEALLRMERLGEHWARIEGTEKLGVSSMRWERADDRLQLVFHLNFGVDENRLAKRPFRYDFESFGLERLISPVAGGTVVRWCVKERRY